MKPIWCGRTIEGSPVGEHSRMPPVCGPDGNGSCKSCAAAKDAEIERLTLALETLQNDYDDEMTTPWRRKNTELNGEVHTLTERVRELEEEHTLLGLGGYEARATIERLERERLDMDGISKDLRAEVKRLREAWKSVKRWLAHRDDETECRELRDGPDTCDCGLREAWDAMEGNAALAKQPIPVKCGNCGGEKPRGIASEYWRCSACAKEDGDD